MTDGQAEAALAFTCEAHDIKQAFAFGKDSESYVTELRNRGIQVGWDEEDEKPAFEQNAFYDLCICVGFCDGLPLANTDDWIDYLSEFASLTIFESGVPGKDKPGEITTQVEDYWISMFEIRGCVAIKGFGHAGHMPILFASKKSLDDNPALKAISESASFEWRKHYQTGAGEVRATEPAKQVGPNTSGESRKIAASVVTYQPNAEQLEHVRHLTTLFDCVVVADNSEPPREPLPGVDWISMKGNKGIAAALNAVCRRARELGYEWLFTLDQDTDVDREHLDTYLDAFKAFGDKNGTAIIAPRTDGRDLPRPQEGEVRELEMVMTSGCLTNLAVWEKICGFADELFIDEVDHDYCLNARKNGYRVVRLVNAYLPHQPGRLMSILTLRGRPTLVGWHPPKRLYYIVRNYFFMKRRYKDVFPEIIAERRRLVIAKFREYLLYHQSRWPSVFAMAKGALHGFLGRFGR
ncbi:MAG: hypothetical protein ABIV13_04820 [Fimbriimonadales bacterium]